MEEEENKRYENEYETARREALGRMKAEEERRQLEDKLQAEALLQQMEELKVQELEVRARPWPPRLLVERASHAAVQRSPGEGILRKAARLRPPVFSSLLCWIVCHILEGRRMEMTLFSAVLQGLLAESLLRARCPSTE